MSTAWWTGTACTPRPPGCTAALHASRHLSALWALPLVVCCTTTGGTCEVLPLGLPRCGVPSRVLRLCSTELSLGLAQSDSGAQDLKVLQAAHDCLLPAVRCTQKGCAHSLGSSPSMLRGRQPLPQLDPARAMGRLRQDLGPLVRVQRKAPPVRVQTSAQHCPHAGGCLHSRALQAPLLQGPAGLLVKGASLTCCSGGFAGALRWENILSLDSF